MSCWIATPPTSLSANQRNLPYSGTWPLLTQPNGENTVVRIGDGKFTIRFRFKCPRRPRSSHDGLTCPVALKEGGKSKVISMTKTARNLTGKRDVTGRPP